ncbi:universal stress protein [Umezawaea endophytica]|uniref:Universal stress protein n=1 Tax=Umezawaea endophytica TaxID=1654476 RepID=A0A9X3AIX8_9PSEU|nr:universal stress protein [Umezawaea endophytica]MCS7483692.1 universal stress protein [Umezawaea endophytica]
MWRDAVEKSGRTKLVVVGVDGSPASAAALRWALEEAVRLGAKVEVITARERELAFTPATTAGPPQHGEKPHRHPVQELHDLVKTSSCRWENPPKMTAVVLVGDPVEELARSSRHADLLVLGAHGHGKAAGVLLGRVVSGCLRRSACPVVVIPPGSVR